MSFNKRIWEILPAAPKHIAAIAADMRAEDAREVRASHGHSPEEALRNALARSELAWTCILSAPAAASDALPAEGVPALMWGVARRGSLMSITGAPWLLGTNLFFSSHRALRREFLRQCPAYVDRMQARFPRLENFVHAENRLSIRWLKWCGFTLEREAVRFNGENFYRFWRERNA